MAYEKVGWSDYPDTRTPLSKKNLDHMDEQIKKNSDSLDKIVGKTYTAGLNKGETEITFSGLTLKTDTKLNLYCRDHMVSPKSVSVTASSVTYTFNKYDYDLVLLLEVI